MKAVPVSDSKLPRKAVDKLCADVEVQAGQKPYWFKMDEKGRDRGRSGQIHQRRSCPAQALTEALNLKPNTLVSPVRWHSDGGQKDGRRYAEAVGRCL